MVGYMIHLSPILSLLYGLLFITTLSLLILSRLLYLQLKNSPKNKPITENIALRPSFDPLTGLSNRIQFFEYCRMRIHHAKHNHQKIALLFLDVDNFRGIKDSLGYALGDTLLQAIAERLAIVMGDKKELLSRLGSDHFTIILENIPHKKNIEQIVSKILHAMGTSFHLLGHEVATSVSIGISIYPDNGETVEQLLKSAGIARHQAKHLGNNAYSYYLAETNEKLAEKRLLELHLRKAILNNELIVCYQPKIDINSRKIIGAEALLQWNNPTLGRVSPAQFIPIAEQTGLIIPIGHWVLNEACQQAQYWHTHGHSELTIAVNLSAYQFKREDIVEQIATVIANTGLNPHLLEFEITESLIMENMEKSLLMLRVLKAMGIQISIDDFGTGHSSLSQITKLPINSLKIDQTFVKKMSAEYPAEAERAIIRAIIAMAKQLKLKIIAEGVETEYQFNFLKKEGCNIIQGYLFSPPIPVKEFNQLLAKNNA